MQIWNFLISSFESVLENLGFTQFEWLGYNVLQWGMYVFILSFLCRFVLFPFFSTDGLVSGVSDRVRREEDGFHVRSRRSERNSRKSG